MARRSPLLSLLPLLGLASTAVCEGEVTRGDGTAYSGEQAALQRCAAAAPCVGTAGAVEARVGWL